MVAKLEVRLLTSRTSWIDTQAKARRIIDHTRASLDFGKLRHYRLERVRAQLRRLDYSGCVLFDPLNIRYATDSRNMAVWTLHNAVRYAYIATEGPVVLFDFHNCEHLSDHLDLIDETRPATAWSYFAAGPRKQERAKTWAAEIADLVTAHGGGNSRLAIDSCNPEGYRALADLGIEVFDAQGVLEQARSIKSAEELACMRASVTTAEAAMARMYEELKPGMTENQLWAIMNEVNASMDGEWIETRLLASGTRCNPWFQESSDAVIQSGDLVSFDTDLVGPFGYCSDISRSFICGPANDEQRRLYRLALEQIKTNMELLRPGLSFRELAEIAWKMPASCLPNRYSVVVHGVGLCDEYPSCVYLEDFETGGYDGHFEAGMTVCVESYMGEEGGSIGVKLEQQVLITETGIEEISSFPFEEKLLNREI
ncbi:M24 family metallopeptidase [Denitrobaculum tricleocarpae]|uniref:M24 family metallopeptidase n=1 Tax=Denitrobaculum tricleocarpae TaxID=2591009 RepID=UPI0015D3220D|nr:Xaa-Pro peptidase family protein [Denitrobaculum tricleocarpae]